MPRWCVPDRTYAPQRGWKNNRGLTVGFPKPSGQGGCPVVEADRKQRAMTLTATVGHQPETQSEAAGNDPNCNQH